MPTTILKKIHVCIAVAALERFKVPAQENRRIQPSNVTSSALLNKDW